VRLLYSTVLPYSVHLAVDFLVGVTFLLVPVVLDFSGLDLWYYWANAAGVLTVVGLHKPSDSSEHVGQQDCGITETAQPTAN